MLMLDLWLQAETNGVTHFGAYNRPPDGHFFLNFVLDTLKTGAKFGWYCCLWPSLIYLTDSQYRAFIFQTKVIIMTRLSRLVQQYFEMSSENFDRLGFSFLTGILPKPKLHWNYLSCCGWGTIHGKNDGDGGSHPGHPGHPGLLAELPQLSRRRRLSLGNYRGGPCHSRIWVSHHVIANYGVQLGHADKNKFHIGDMACQRTIQPVWWSIWLSYCPLLQMFAVCASSEWNMTDSLITTWLLNMLSLS